jgi:hypothetical protein
MAATADESFELFFEHRLDGGADSRPKAILDRVELRLVSRWRKAHSVDNLVHGVISLAVGAAGWVDCKSPGDYDAFQLPPLPRHDQSRETAPVSQTPTHPVS